jgi:putative ATPase
LPFVEKGSILLIGATTENPSFEVISPLLSRCQVFVFKPLNRKHISKIINRALKNKERGFGNLNIKIEKNIIDIIAQMSNGDARKALNVIEYAVLTSPNFEYFQLSKPKKNQGEKSKLSSSPFAKAREGEETSSLLPPRSAREGGKNEIKITADIVKEAFQKSYLLYDKRGEEHYNIISALHKSMRGSDADAALYWLARMIEAGEDPLYIARRIIRFASEDIGLTNSRALEQAVAVYQTCHFIGVPECNLALAQAVVYMAKCKKSNELYVAYEKAARDVKEYGNLPIPLHLRNAPTQLMKDLGYGEDYKYSPNFNYKEKQKYFPEKLKRRKYFN